MGSRFLNYIGGIGSIGIGKFCPVCYPVVGAFLSAIGLGFAVSAVVLKGLLVLFLCIGILGLWRSYRAHRNLMPIVTGSVSSLVLYTGKYLLVEDAIFYTGIIGLLGAVIWDMKVKRAVPCPACVENKVVKERG